MNLGDAAIDEAAFVLWGLAQLTGRVTTTGTAQQDAFNPDKWTYSPTPSDRLIIKYASGPTEEFVFTSADGYFQGDWSDLAASHRLEFHLKIAGRIDLQVNSTSIPSPPQSGAVDFNRQLKGGILFQNSWWTVDCTHSGRDSSYVDMDYTYKKVVEKVTGAAQTENVQFSFNDQRYTELIYYRNQFLQTRALTNNSSLNVGNLSYRYADVLVYWIASTQFADSAYAGHFNNAIELYNWKAEGTLFKNSSRYGTVIFDHPTPSNEQYGYCVFVKTINGDQYLVHPLLHWWLATGVATDAPVLPEQFSLMQNFPNPFNPETEIPYYLPRPAQVVLELFDLRGRKLKVLVNQLQGKGLHRLRFNAQGLPSGVYFYRLKAGEWTEVRKMILKK
jgi:hypothetical protein